MEDRVILTKYKSKIMLARFEKDRMESLSFYDSCDNSLGTVFLCRVTKVLNNINGAFIQYQKGCNGFIKGEGYKPEQIIPLQLKKEGSHNKEPLFTDKITLSSQYVIIGRGPAHVSVSSKLTDDIKNRFISTYKALADELCISIIIRTNANSVPSSEVEASIRYLYDKLKEIESYKDNRTLYSILYRPEKSYIKDILDFSIGSYSEIVTDIPEIYDELLKLMNGIAHVRLYNDALLSLFHLNKMEHNIKNATDSIIPLKSGAEIVINHTEALTAIDINTHNTKINKDKETTFFETNKEAAKEIVRQLRIRNISGMIIIDFINMEQESHYSDLFDYINNLCISDPVGLKAIDITGLKLIEMVRTKRRKTLIEQMR